jgi:methanogenic corrinoid protein MtbC1
MGRMLCLGIYLDNTWTRYDLPVMAPRSSPRGPAPQGAGHFIAAVAARTGLSQDVLRVWERRYGAVEPTRSAGNQRLYSDDDIARFRLLAAATSTGRSIRNVANLSTAALEALVAEDNVRAGNDRASDGAMVDAGRLDAALAFAIALDGAGLDASLRRSITEGGLPRFLEVDAPALMRRVGDEWEAGRLSVAHEHLASGIVLNVILDAIRGLPTTPTAPRLLVATLSHERHGVGAALAAAVAALEGWAVVHLGVDVPATDIASSAAAAGARAVAMSILHESDRAHVLREVGAVRKGTPPTLPVIVGGAAAVAMGATLAATGAVVCRSFADFRAELARAAHLPLPDAS